MSMSMAPLIHTCQSVLVDEPLDQPVLATATWDVVTNGELTERFPPPSM